MEDSKGIDFTYVNTSKRSKKTAEIIGFENLRKPNIKSYIEAKQKKQQDKLEITQERVLKELARIAFPVTRNNIDNKDNL